jgi:hypothetical protein
VYVHVSIETDRQAVAKQAVALRRADNDDDTDVYEQPALVLIVCCSNPTAN